MTRVRYSGEELWDRIARGETKIRQRLERVTNALDAAEVSYGLFGDSAVQIWVAQVDESVVRATRDVDILLNRGDFERARAALEAAGFVYRHANSIDMFLDGPDAKARDAEHVVFAGEKIREEYPTTAPTLDETERIDQVRLLSLDALVKMKLTSFRDKDRTHLRDMLEVGLIDKEWPGRMPEELGTRLQGLIDDPDG